MKKIKLQTLKLKSFVTTLDTVSGKTIVGGGDNIDPTSHSSKDPTFTANYLQCNVVGTSEVENDTDKQPYFTVVNKKPD